MSCVFPMCLTNSATYPTVASQPALLWPPWNRKNLHHLSCCQRTLWVSKLCCLWNVVKSWNCITGGTCCITHPQPELETSALYSVECFAESSFKPLSSCIITLRPKSRAVQTEGAGAQRLWWARHPGHQREGQELRSAHCGRNSHWVSCHWWSSHVVQN